MKQEFYATVPDPRQQIVEEEVLPRRSVYDHAAWDFLLVLFPSYVASQF